MTAEGATFHGQDAPDTTAASREQVAAAEKELGCDLEWYDPAPHEDPGYCVTHRRFARPHPNFGCPVAIAAARHAQVALDAATARAEAAEGHLQAVREFAWGLGASTASRDQILDALTRQPFVKDQS